MSRAVVVIGGLSVIVLGLLIGLWLLLMKHDDAAARSTPTPPPEPVASGAPHGGTTTSPGTAVPAPVVPPGSGDNPREYEVGGMRVRDHRSGDHKVLDVPPNLHPPGGHAIQSTTTNAVSQKLQVVMKECMASVPATARGEKPRLEGQVTVAIKNNKVAVTASTVQLRNIADDAAAPAKQCIEQKALGVSAPVTGESDVENYTINISFAVP